MIPLAFGLHKYQQTRTFHTGPERKQIFGAIFKSGLGIFKNQKKIIPLQS